MTSGNTTTWLQRTSASNTPLLHRHRELLRWLQTAQPRELLRWLQTAQPRCTSCHMPSAFHLGGVRQPPSTEPVSLSTEFASHVPLAALHSIHNVEHIVAHQPINTCLLHRLMVPACAPCCTTSTAPPHRQSPRHRLCRVHHHLVDRTAATIDRQGNHHPIDPNVATISRQGHLQPMHHTVATINQHRHRHTVRTTCGVVPHGNEAPVFTAQRAGHVSHRPCVRCIDLQLDIVRCIAVVSVDR